MLASGWGQSVRFVYGKGMGALTHGRRNTFAGVRTPIFRPRSLRFFSHKMPIMSPYRYLLPVGLIPAVTQPQFDGRTIDIPTTQCRESRHGLARDCSSTRSRQEPGIMQRRSEWEHCSDHSATWYKTSFTAALFCAVTSHMTHWANTPKTSSRMLLTVASLPGFYVAATRELFELHVTSQFHEL